MGNLCSLCCDESKLEVQDRSILQNRILLMKLKADKTIKESHCKIEKLSNSVEYMAFNNRLLKEENSYLMNKYKASHSAYLQKTVRANAKQEFDFQKIRRGNIAISREVTIYQKKVSLSCIFKNLQNYKTYQLKSSLQQWIDATFPKNDMCHRAIVEMDKINLLKGESLYSSAKKLKDKKASDKYARFPSSHKNQSSKLLRMLLTSIPKHQKESENIDESDKLSLSERTFN